MTDPKLERLAPGVTDGEKRMWLAALRSDAPPSKDALAELADILERQWFPPLDGGRPGKETWTAHHKANRALRAWYLIGLIEDRQAAGTRRDIAESEVAASIGIERRALQAIIRDA